MDLKDIINVSKYTIKMQKQIINNVKIWKKSKILKIRKKNRGEENYRREQKKGYARKN